MNSWKLPWLALCCMHRAMSSIPSLSLLRSPRRSAQGLLLLGMLLLARRLWAEPSVPAPIAVSSVPTSKGVPSVPSMTLQEALAYARFHQPELRAARERLLAASADARIPSAEWLPSAGATLQVIGSSDNNSTATVLSSDVLDLPRIGGTTIQSKPAWQPYATTLAAVGLRQEIFDFGRIAAQTAASDALVAIERDRLQVAHLDITFVVTQAYYAAKAARAVMQAAAQAEQRSQVHSDFADVGVKSGLRPPIELTRAAANLARFRVGRIRAEGNLRIARSVFAAAVGSPEPELDSTPIRDSVPPTPPLAQVEQRALAYQPEVLQALDRRKAQRSQTLAISATTRPNLFATAAVSARAGGAPSSTGLVAEGRGLLPSVPNYDAGLILAWPFYEPTVDAAASASRQREWAYVAEIAAAQQKALAAAQQVYRRTRVAESALEALAQAAEAARANYAQADARFRAGLGTSTELADAEALRLEAEVQEAVGHFELATARANLARVMGE